MSDYNNSQGRNQRGSNRERNNDWNQDRNRNSNENDRSDKDDRGNEDSGPYGFNNQNDRNYGNNNQNQWQDSQGNDRWNNDNNYNSSYGSDRGLRKGRQDSWESGRNHSIYNNDQDFGNNRNGSGSRSGNQGSGNNDYNNFNERQRNQNQHQDRGWWDKTRDEVSSWFGDDHAERRRKQDDHQAPKQGPHRGKGPKGYTRSDERIQEDINDRLSDDHHLDASDINVTVSNGEVVLTGSVDSRQSKRYAEDLVEAVSGVKNVENRLRVGTESRSTSPGADLSSGTKGFTGNTDTGNIDIKKS